MPQEYKSLEILTTQPAFPDEDLTEANAAHIQYLLNHEHPEAAYANFLKNSLRMVYITGNKALEMSGVFVMEDSPKEYEAFCAGFAAMEYTTQIVGARRYDTTLAIGKARELFIKAPTAGENIIYPRYERWIQDRPNTRETILSPGEQNEETTAQLYARSMGAHIASDLQQLI